MAKKSNQPTSSLGLDKANTDVKLSKTHIHYEYAFNWGVDVWNRVVCITDEINSDLFSRLDAALNIMEAENRKSITLRINSEGGKLYDAIAIVGRINRSPCKIITEGYGSIMSAAALILASGDKRRVSKYSWIMWHEPSYGPDDERHSQMKALIEQKEKENRFWAQWMAEFTLQNKYFWLDKGSYTDFYCSPEEAVEYGIIDEIV